MKIYNLLFEKALFPISELVRGTTILKKLEFLEKSQYWSQKKLGEYQNKRLRQLIRHAYDNVSYYKELFKNNRLKPNDIQTKKDLRKLPILTKEIIREEYEKLQSSKMFRGTYNNFTSGSTGTPMKFCLNKEDFSWIWAAHFRKWKWTGYKLGDRYVKISLNNSRIRPSKKIQDILMNCLYIYSYEINDESIAKYIEDIRKFKPRVVYGYASQLRLIADYLESENLKLEVNTVISTGENLFATDRDKIVERFSCTLYDEYGCGGEGLNIAAQCQNGSYHINDELMIVEVEKGEIIITSLNNYSMPLIRYKLGDLVKLGKICACGRKSTTLEKINGRSRDIIHTSNGKTLVLQFFATLFEYLEGIEHFKIIQHTSDSIQINIVKNAKFDKALCERRITEYIQNSAGKRFRIQFKYVKQIPLERNGKRRMIISTVQ